MRLPVVHRSPSRPRLENPRVECACPGPGVRFLFLARLMENRASLMLARIHNQINAMTGQYTPLKVAEEKGYVDIVNMIQNQ